MPATVRHYLVAQMQAGRKTATIQRRLAAIADDLAMLLFGFAAALRRSELARLDVGEVAFAKRVLVVTIRRSKSDQEGARAKVAVAPGADPAACPVRVTRRWLQAAHLGATGPLFRPVHRTGSTLDRRLNPEHVAQLGKHAAAAAGVAPLDLDGAADTTGLAGHSLRAGLVTQAALDGVPDADIAAATRHKSRDMVARYTRIADPFRAGVGGKVKL